MVFPDALWVENYVFFRFETFFGIVAEEIGLCDFFCRLFIFAINDYKISENDLDLVCSMCSFTYDRDGHLAEIYSLGDEGYSFCLNAPCCGYDEADGICKAADLGD